MNLGGAISSLVSGENLSFDRMIDVTREIMAGKATAAQIAAFLVALRMKGETIDELAGAATVMRELSTKIEVDVNPLVDTCGTGGDGARTFNVSTAAAFVVAAAGAYVAKHGNRSVSSSSGSADVLEAAGAVIDLKPPQIASCIKQTGVGFMFAPSHHGAMKHAAGPRRELGIRTMFNALGPLTNPANAPIQLMGVFDRQWVSKAAEVLCKLGTRRAMVVHGEDGLDEITIGAKTHVAELSAGKIRAYEIDPRDFGIETRPPATLAANDAEHSLQIIRSVYAGEPGPARDIVAINAGAAIYLAGLADNLTDGYEQANELIANGAAGRRLESFVAFTRTVGDSADG